MKPMRLTFKAGERLYINGAVINFPRKTSIELLNNAEFLLENQIMQIEETTTPLRQLYFIAQLLLTSPANAEDAFATLIRFATSLTSTIHHYRLCAGVQEVVDLVNSGSIYDAMKRIRELYPLEAELLGETSLLAPEVVPLNRQSSGVAGLL